MRDDPFERLLFELTKLPGIGRKTAQRLGLFLLRSPKQMAHSLALSIQEAVDRVVECSVCHALAFAPLCKICVNPNRERSSICVVEDDPDVVAIEASGLYRGLYHILHGLISPAEGVNPESLRILALQRRVEQGEVKEVILALNSTLEGEATAYYLTEKLKRLGVSLSHIAYGIPVGGDLEYVDGLTIGRALENRVRLIREEDSSTS